MTDCEHIDVFWYDKDGIGVSRELAYYGRCADCEEKILPDEGPTGMTAKRVSQILLKRSASIYGGMKARARKDGFKDLPFTLGVFRLWLEGVFDADGAGRCEYSGEMILVENFSVDHRIPVSRGGSFALENLALCSAKQNLRKGNMTKVEYFAFRDFVVMYMRPEVQESIWKRLEIGDVQRFSHFRRQKKLAHQ